MQKDERKIRLPRGLSHLARGVFISSVQLHWFPLVVWAFRLAFSRSSSLQPSSLAGLPFHSSVQVCDFPPTFPVLSSSRLSPALKIRNRDGNHVKLAFLPIRACFILLWSWQILTCKSTCKHISHRLKHACLEARWVSRARSSFYDSPPFFPFLSFLFCYHLRLQRCRTPGVRSLQYKKQHQGRMPSLSKRPSAISTTWTATPFTKRPCGVG